MNEKNVNPSSEKEEINYESYAKELMDYIQEKKNPTVDLKDLIDMLDNPIGLWKLRKLINKLYVTEIYACDSWNTIFEQKPTVFDFPVGYENYYTKIKQNVYRGLMKIEQDNLSFFCKLGFVYTEVKNSVDNSQYKNLEKRHMKLVSRVNRLSTDLINDDNIIANKVKSGIYPEFITILGIFTAITFAIFGGINTINSISSNLHISSSNPQNLGNLLIAAAVLGIVLFGIITVLFAGIAKITEKDYILPTLLTISVLAIISAMFMIGLVFTFLTNKWNLSIWPQIIVSVAVIAVIAVIIAVATYIKCKFNNFKKSSDNQKQKDNSSVSENN